MAEEATSWVKLRYFVTIFFILFFWLGNSLFILREIICFLVEEFVGFRPFSQFAMRSRIVDGNSELQVMKTAVLLAKLPIKCTIVIKLTEKDS